jgi:hypothetical protein
MKPKYLERDLNQRLEGGIVFYNDEPFLVDRVDQEDHCLVLSCLKTGARKAVNPYDDDLNIKSPTLGYANNRNRALYVTRLPRRSYKQAISTRECRGYVLGTTETTNVDFSTLKSAVLGEYPTVTQALNKIRHEGYSSCAISRDVAITIDDIGLVKFYYKNILAGFIDPLNPKVDIRKMNKFFDMSNILEVLKDERDW